MEKFHDPLVAGKDGGVIWSGLTDSRWNMKKRNEKCMDNIENGSEGLFACIVVPLGT